MMWHLDHPHDFFIAGILLGMMVTILALMFINLIRVTREERAYMREIRAERRRG